MFGIRINLIVAMAAFILSLLLSVVSRASMPVLILRPLVFGIIFFALSVAVKFLINQFLPELMQGADPDVSNDIFTLGSRVNITEGEIPDSPQAYTSGIEGGGAPVDSTMPAFMKGEESADELGDISDLLKRRPAPRPQSEETSPEVKTGMDQNAEAGYNGVVQLEEFPETEALSFLGNDAPVPDAFSAPSQAPAPSQEPASAGGDLPVEEPTGIPDSVDFLPDLDSMAGAFMSASPGEGSGTIEYSNSTPAAKPSSGNKSAAWSGDFNAKDIASGLRTVLNKDKEG